MITLINTDCLPAMKEMPDKAYDLAIVDPPYGDGAGGVGNHEQHNHKSVIREREREREWITGTASMDNEKSVSLGRSL